MALFGFGKKKQEEQAAAQRAEEARIAAEKKAAEEAQIAAEKKAAEEAAAAEVAAFTITDEDSVTAALSRGVELYRAGMPAQALVLFQKGAEHGNRYAQSMLASLYQRGEGTEQDHKKALYWCLQSAKAGYADAQFNAALMFVNGEGTEKSNLDALKWLKEAAGQDHEGAKAALARNLSTKEQYQTFVAEGYFQKYQGCLKRGIDQEITLKWLNQAAKYGHAEAQFELGTMYAYGRGVDKNDAEAAKWLRAAAEQGLDMACLVLGIRYNDRQNYPEAEKWFRAAAVRGHAWSQCELGKMCFRGHGVEQNYAEAVKWFRFAAEQGFADAQYNLGVCYWKGVGVERNYTEALTWYRAAAEQGFPNAQFELARMYLNGYGVKEDYAEARKWLRAAAAQGHAAAQRVLDAPNQRDSAPL